MAAPPNFPVIASGNTGNNVRALQALLNFKNKNTALAVDGIFGPLTKNAVINYQKSNGLVPDGLAGPLTLTKLTGDVIVRNPNTSMAARAAQCLLNKFGSSLVVDGIFGPKSEAATKAFQTKMGIVPDGGVGPVAWRYLLGYNAYPHPGK